MLMEWAAVAALLSPAEPPADHFSEAAAIHHSVSAESTPSDQESQTFPFHGPRM